MPFSIIRNDLTNLRVDAIVNAANTALQMGGGVCGAIFKAAGPPELQAACDLLAPIGTGEAVITPGFRLPAKYVIHTAGPVYRDGKHGEKEQLRHCYLNALKRAVENGCKSIAFPLISSGIFGYPKEEALQAAVSSISEFLADHDINVTLVVFDKTSFAVSKKLLGEVDAFIDENYAGTADDSRQFDLRMQAEFSACYLREAAEPEAGMVKELAAPDLETLVGHLDEPFSQTLMRLIDAKGKTDVEVYKRANLDRKLFSKIRSKKGYTPGKRTAIALAVALELSLGETEDLLKRAGYGLSRSQKFDVIIEYFITRGQFNIFEINQVLFSYDQPLLGG